MSTQMDTLRTKLVGLGLSDDEARLYVELTRSPPTSVLTLSRALDIPRTTAYRIIERLIDMNLVTQDRRSSLTALPPAALENLMRRRQQNLDEQKRMLPSLMGELANLAGVGPFGSRVQYYSGLEGLRRVTLNSLEAVNDICIYELADMNAFFPYDEAERIRAALVERNIRGRQLTNQKRLGQWTDNAEFVRSHSQIRHIAATELSIDFEVLIYNDVYCVYTYREDEIFCAEIRSQALAQMQRQLFDFVWMRAKPMKFLDDHGTAVIAR